jgi:hypothetical protein
VKRRTKVIGAIGAIVFIASCRSGSSADPVDAAPSGTGGVLGGATGGAGTGGDGIGGSAAGAAAGGGASAAGGRSGGAGGNPGGAGGGGRGGNGAASANACGDTCTPGASCDAGCLNGARRICSCYLDQASGAGKWGCSSQGACGSNQCGNEGASCDIRFPTACNACDAGGNHVMCTCNSVTATTGKWSCLSSPGTCGISCGDRKCLSGELCINFGQYPGTLPPDGGSLEPILRPTCVAVPDACAGQAPTCANCIVPLYGCSPPGMCRQNGTQTFDCILGGA